MSCQKIRIAYLNYWDDDLNDRYFSKFIEYHFLGIETLEVSPFENPDIMICSVFGDLNLISRLRASIKIFYTGENLRRKEYREFQNIKILQNIFDLIIGFYETDIKSKLLGFPLWLQYYPFYSTKEDETIVSYIEKQHIENRHVTKERFCTLIARHDRTGIRTKISKSVSKIGKISYGGTFHLVQFQKEHFVVPYGSRAKVDYIKTSKYNICPENSSTQGYCTEKLFEALQAGCIPIYSGYDIPVVLNKNKIIFYKEDIPEEQFLQNFQTVYKFDGNVFENSAEETISNYYEDLKNQLSLLIRSRTALKFTIFEPQKSFRNNTISCDEDSSSNDEDSFSNDEDSFSNDNESSSDDESSFYDDDLPCNNILNETTSSEITTNCSNCCVLEQPLTTSYNGETNANIQEQDKEVTNFVQDLLKTLEAIAKEKIKSKARKNLRKISDN